MFQACPLFPNCTFSLGTAEPLWLREGQGVEDRRETQHLGSQLGPHWGVSPGLARGQQSTTSPQLITKEALSSAGMPFPYIFLLSLSSVQGCWPAWCCGKGWAGPQEVLLEGLNKSNIEQSGDPPMHTPVQGSSFFDPLLPSSPAILCEQILP